MEAFATLPHSTSSAEDPHVGVLIADDDDRMRSLFAACASKTIQAILVLEANDGAEALLLGLRQGPQIALLDINMPRLGGIEVATTLRELRPRMRLALHTADPDAHRDRARAHRLPLFDKRDLDRTLSWFEVQAEALLAEAGRRVSRTHDLECSSCGYGISCLTPPRSCPMCHREGPWIHGARRLIARAAARI